MLTAHVNLDVFLLADSADVDVLTSIKLMYIFGPRVVISPVTTRGRAARSMCDASPQMLRSKQT